MGSCVVQSVHVGTLRFCLHISSKRDHEAPASSEPCPTAVQAWTNQPWAVAVDPSGAMVCWAQTERHALLLRSAVLRLPMPNATVATMMGTTPLVQSRCTASRSSGAKLAW